MNARFKRSEKLKQSNSIRIKRLSANENYDNQSLLYAVSNKDHDRMRLLLSNKTDIDQVNRPSKNGLTPLMMAAFNGDVKATKILIEYGAASSIYSIVPNTSKIALRGKNALDIACEKYGKSYAEVFNILLVESIQLSHPYPVCIDHKITYRKQDSPETNKLIVEVYEADNNTNTLKKTIRHFVPLEAITAPTIYNGIIKEKVLIKDEESFSEELLSRDLLGSAHKEVGGSLLNSLLMPVATTMATTTISNMIKYTSDSSMQNRLANATVGFINSTVSENTDWSTGAVVGTTVAFGSLAIVSGVGIYCYLSKKVESYNNSLDLNKIG